MGESVPDKRIAELVHSNMSMAYEYAIKMFQMRYREYGLEQSGRYLLDSNSSHAYMAIDLLQVFVIVSTSKLNS